jgi:hypothetical protein
LKVATVASVAAGGKPSACASSPIEFALIAGNTDGMKRPMALASMIEATWSGRCATNRPQMA